MPLLFTENETNTQRTSASPTGAPYVKDGINNYIVHGQEGGRKPGEERAPRSRPHYRLTIEPGECQVIRLRLCDRPPSAAAQANGQAASPFGSPSTSVLQARRKEADEFYAAVIPLAERRRGQRHAAGPGRDALDQAVLHYDVDKWLEERGSDPFKATGKAAPRNDHWHHMYNGDVISMPDKWEYPWYAAWDLAFHVLALTLVDLDFGKQQLKLMLGERYMHPNGQIPAYEWNFGDVNPPVHAWSPSSPTPGRQRRRAKGTRVAQELFQKLLLNFTWWVNRKDPLRGRRNGAGQYRPGKVAGRRGPCKADGRGAGYRLPRRFGDECGRSSRCSTATTKKCESSH